MDTKRILLAFGMAAAAFAPAAAGAVDEAYFKGKLMRIVVPYDPGGTYDLYGQSFSKHLMKYIPGNPTIIMQYMPGAGGAKAMNWAYTQMPRDGLYMVTHLDNTVVNQLLAPDQSKYDSRKFNFVGASNQTNIVMVVRTDTGINSWQDLTKKEYVGSAVGTADTAYLGPRLANGLIGTKVRVVTGYKGSNPAIMAIEQRESDLSMYNWLAWVSRAHWFQGDKPFAKPILQIGFFKDPDLSPDVPMLSDLVKNEEDKKVVAFVASLGALGRGLALPPEVSKDMIALMRKAYDQMNADKEFEAELKKRNLRLIPKSGEEIQKIVEDAVSNAKPDVVARAAKIIYGK